MPYYIYILNKLMKVVILIYDCVWHLLPDKIIWNLAPKSTIYPLAPQQLYVACATPSSSFDFHDPHFSCLQQVEDQRLPCDLFSSTH